MSDIGLFLSPITFSLGTIQILRNALGGRGSRILLRFVTSIGGGGEGLNDHLLRNDFKFSKRLKFQKHHFLVISISLKLFAPVFCKKPRTLQSSVSEKYLIRAIKSL